MRHPSYEQHSTPLPDLNKIARIGLAVVALAAGSAHISEEAEARSVGNPYLQAANELENRVSHGRPVSYEANSDLLWSQSSSNKIGRLPLKATVSGEELYFRLKQRGKTRSSIDVAPITKDVTEVQSSLTKNISSKGTWTSTDVVSSKGVVKLNSRDKPIIRVRFEDGDSKKVRAGKVSEARTQGETQWGGKRFADTAAERKLTGAKSIEQAQKALQTFLHQYDLEANILSAESSTFGSYDLLGSEDLDELKKYGSIFIDEWSKYPADWVKHTELKKIALVKNLTFGTIKRPAVPDGKDGVLLFDVGYGAEEYARRVIHHEYFHNYVFSQYDRYDIPDQTWNSLNPPGFKYYENGGGDGCYRTADNCPNEEHPAEGLITGYAGADETEDQAEVASYLMTTGPYNRLKQWMASDPYLAKKAEYIKSHFLAGSSKMDDGYYDAVNPDYTSENHF